MTRTKNSGRNSNNKRRQWETRDEETVDDLAHAATFAMMAPPISSTPPAVLAAENQDDKEDDNEIEMSDDDVDSDSGEISKGEAANNEEKEIQDGMNDDDKEDEVEDDESDVDLAEAVAKMMEGDDEEPTMGAGKPPKTAHELDPYQTPIQELEQHLQFQLNVQDHDPTQTKLRNLEASNLSLAGKLKHFMMIDRTVVVESMPHKNGMAASPLDEGSLLVVRQPGVSDSLIPLGRIFEVFGPVTQPLYTIRLPPPPPKPSKTSTKSKISRSGTDEKKEEGENNISDLPEKDTSSTQEQVKDEAAATTEEPKSLDPTVQVEVEGKGDATIEKEKPSDLIPNMKRSTPVEEETKDTSTAKLSTKSTAVQDHWAPDGDYSELLRNNESIAVYYVLDEAKLLDTGAIMRSSGKGCDASNIYDEEDLNANEMYYSDDEQERAAKSRRKPGKGQQQRNQTSNGGPPIPRGFHQPPPQGFHNPPPQGFHPPLAQQQQQSTHPPNIGQPAFPYHGGASMPPPPPPPPGMASAPPPYPTAPGQNNGNIPYYQY